MNTISCLVGTTMLLASAVHAEGFYVGGSIGVGDATLRTSSQFDDPDDNLFVAKGIGGYRANRFLAIESTIVAASNDDYDDGFDGDTDVSFGAATLSLLGIIPLNEKVELYAKFGGYVGESEVDDTFLFFGRDDDEDGAVWGGGLFINFGSREQFTIRIDYEQFDTDALRDFWTVNGGFQYNF